MDIAIWWRWPSVDVERCETRQKAMSNCTVRLCADLLTLELGLAFKGLEENSHQIPFGNGHTLSWVQITHFWLSNEKHVDGTVEY